MPRKKSNLNNASTREARRKRIKRAHQLAEQIESRNPAQRIRTAEGHAQESQEQCNERLQENIIRTRAAGERDIATASSKIFHSALKSIQTKVEAVVNIKYEDDDVVEVVNGPSKEESTTSEVKSETVSEESDGKTDVKNEDSFEEAIKIEDTKLY